MIYCAVLKLREVAASLECRLEGDGEIDIRGVASIENARPGDLTFFANRRYSTALRTTKAGAVILGVDAEAAPCAMLRSTAPYLAFANAVSLFADVATPTAGVDAQSSIAPDARLGEGVSIGPFVSIGAGVVVGARTVLHPGTHIGAGATIGADCVIHSQVAIRERVAIGDRVVLQNAAVIGSDGYGFAQRPDGTHQKIPQLGGVVLEDDVEVGAHVAIDRPAVGETRIQAGAKIDNLVQIGHGVKVGRNALLAAQVGIAGSTTIEDDVVLAGQVGVNGHVTVGKGTRATGQTGITNTVPAGSFISGLPAIDNRAWRKAASSFGLLPELRKRVAALERRLAELEEAPVPSDPKTEA
jgi:UDP-3-O-[3-hydroxymyristoyl] glucosamine N-acyltransferase